jgi:hypothetical protein
MDSYVCTRWIFIFDSDQAQINSGQGTFFRAEKGKKMEETAQNFEKRLSGPVPVIFSFGSRRLLTNLKVEVIGN